MASPQVLNAAVLRMPVGWHLASHQHPRHEEMEVILAGRMETEMAGRRFVSGPGGFKRHPVGMAHAERLLDGPPMTLLLVALKVPDPHLRAHLPVELPDRGGRLAAAFAWMVDLFQARTAGHQEAADHLLAAVDDLLTRAAGGESDLARLVRALVTDRLSSPISLDDLAAAAHLSRFHFLRRFRAETGCTPMRFVTSLRVEAARSLRQATGMPLRAIAPLVGLGDGDRLSRLLGRRRDA